MMTRRDYVVSANILSDAITRAVEELPENSKELYFTMESVQYVAERFAEYFASDNERFSEEVFFAAVWKEN